MARSMVRAKAADDWAVSEKVFTGVVHRPRRTRLTRLRTPTRSEGGRRRCRAHWRGRQRQSSTTVKVGVQWLGEQLRALAVP
jgi:hypothetical protein